MTTFLKTIGSNHVLENRQFVFAPKIQYKLAAERSEANLQNLQFPQWCAGEDLNLHAHRAHPPQGCSATVTTPARIF